MTSVNSTGSEDFLARRKSSIKMDLGGLTLGKPRKLSRNQSSFSLTSSNPLSPPISENGRRSTVSIPRRLSHFSGGKVGVEPSKSTTEKSNHSLPPVEENRRMNFTNIVILRRLTRALRQRVADKKSEKRTFCWLDRTSSSRSGANDVPDEVQFEPTYRMEPNHKLSETKCKEVVEKCIAEKLENTAYNQDICRELSKELSDEIRLCVKTSKLLPPRYKCVVYVVLGEKRDQAVQVSSESAWDKNTDSFVSVSYQNNSIFCVATVFAVYME